MNEEFMREAIRLSLEGLRAGNGGPFGAVVVSDGRIIGRGSNRVTSVNDPTAHAEIVAIREACANRESFRLDGCQIYSNCEPCPMCLAAIYWARIETMYYANTRHDAAEIGFDDELIYNELALPAGRRKLPMVQMMRDEALPAFREWENKPDKIKY